MPPHEVVFLVNPASANGSTGRRWPKIAHVATEAGLRGSTQLSTRPGEIGDLAYEASQNGAGLIVVVGGDGTVNEAVNGLMRAAPDSRPDLAVIPRGTGTDFVRSFKIPKKVERAADVAANGIPKSIDVGRVSYQAWNRSPEVSHFVNAGGAGISGAIAKRANSTSKALGGKLSFLWAVLAVYSGWDAGRIEVDLDGDSREAAMLEVLVTNAGYVAGGMRVAPDADPADGLFDVILVGDLTTRELLPTLAKVYRGRHFPHAKLELVRTKRVAVQGAEPLPIQLDGEQPGTTPAVFEVVPQAIRLRVPR